MYQYSRADGIQCQAIQFMGGGDEVPAHVFELLCHLNDAGLQATWIPTEETDEWIENEDGEPEQVIIPEHIQTLSKDMLKIGDYIVKRDGDTYIQEGRIFEAIWSLSVTDNPEEWEWLVAERLPYSKKAGLWRNINDPDIVSMDGGRSYFRMSERPNYAPYGKLYQSEVAIGVNA